MSIKDEGFLAKEIENWRKVHVGRNRDWFALASEMNRLCHELWNNLPTSGDEERWFFTARLLFLRGATSFQAAIILLTHGLTVDASTIARSLFEDIFCLAASKKDEALVERLIGAHHVARRKIARAVAQLPPDLGLEATDAERLNKFADQYGADGQTLNFAEIASVGGLRPVYDIYYRSLSNDSAHPSLDSLERLLKTNAAGEIESFAVGPDATDVAQVIAILSCAGFYLLVTGAQLFGKNDLHEKATATFETYKKLASATFKRLNIPELQQV